jgi:hypothetical protein
LQVTRRYAENTSVSVERSKLEIERLVQRYGAAQFFSGWADGGSVIGFRMRDRFVRFRLPLPDKSRLSQDRYDQEQRRRWRALVLVLKAKLTAVDTGISDFETEFLGNITVANGQTVGEWAKPQLAEMYERGNMPPLLPSGGGR